MRRFSIRACHFMDAYEKGLNGKQAAWASKRYRAIECFRIVFCATSITFVI
ncbi:hypothetical protein BDR07DRAFT_1437785, partial [Suillus spraguei]